MRIGLCLVALSASCWLAACGEESSGPPVIVYADAAGAEALPEFLAGFTAETGIPVQFVFGASSELTDRVIRNDGTPPPDVLMTSNVADIWRAADEGALRPLSDRALELSHPRLSDPEGFWIASAVHWIGIASSDEQAIGALLGGFDALGEADKKQHLCLASSELAYNRALIASLIDVYGVKPAERLVRRWIRNLALPPFATEDQLLAAVRDGRCDIGILTKRPGAHSLSFADDRRFLDIDGVGVARHTLQAASAERLVEWLARQERTDPDWEIRPVAIAGWLDEDARLLAERAGFQ